MNLLKILKKCTLYEFSTYFHAEYLNVSLTKAFPPYRTDSPDKDIVVGGPK